MANQNLSKIRENPDQLDSVVPGDLDFPTSYGYYGESASGNERNQLFKVFATLRKYWPLIVIVPLIVTAVVIVYEAQKPDFYKAKVRIQVNSEVNPASGAGGGSVIIAPSNDPGYFSTQLQIIEGPGLLRRVIKTTDLENNPLFWNPQGGRKPTVWQNVGRMMGVSSAQAATRDEPAPKVQAKINTGAESPVDPDAEAEKLAPYVSTISNNLTVMPVMDGRTANQQTRLIEVEVKHNDPTMAAKIVNAIADTYVLYNLEQKTQTNADAGDFLQKRVAELQSQIRLGEEQLINYAKNNQILSLDNTQNTVVQRLTDLNTKLGQAESERITAEAAYRAALQNPMLNQSAETRDARTAALQAQLSTLQQQLSQLKAEYTDEWPAVISTRRQIEGIQSELQNSKKRATDTQLANLEQPYREALARERELRTNFDQQKNAVLVQNEAAIYYRIIQQEIETNKKLLDGLLQRSRETEVILNGTPNNVHVVDRALVPRSPEGPQRSKNVLMAFMASLTFAVGLAFLLNWFDDTVRHNDELEMETGLPVVGMIPSASGKFGKRLLPAMRKITGKQRASESTYDLESFDRPLLKEAYHQLRTSLMLSSPGGPAQTILVTSAQPAEGKSITAYNIAKSLSELGKRVLIIDADLRFPRLHSIANMVNRTGLSTLLTTAEVKREIIAHAIQRQDESNLYVMTAGPITPNPANLLSSTEMANLLSKLSEQFAYIIIDSPPVLYFADSTILATYVKGVVLIVRDNKSSLHEILRTKKILGEVRARILGLVINDVPASSHKYYKSDYYTQLEALPSDGEASVLHLGG